MSMYDDSSATERKIRVVAVEDERLYLDLLKVALEGYADIEVVGTFSDGNACLEAAPDLEPDVALLDIELSNGPSGLEVGQELKSRLPRIGIVLLSNHLHPEFVFALRKNKTTGWSYLDKKNVTDVDTLYRAIVGAVDGRVVLDHGLLSASKPKEGSQIASLTRRQTEILELIALGFSNAAIAEALFVTNKTVENHINTLYQALDIPREPTVQPRVLAVLKYLDQTRFSDAD